MRNKGKERGNCIPRGNKRLHWLWTCPASLKVAHVDCYRYMKIRTLGRRSSEDINIHICTSHPRNMGTSDQSQAPWRPHLCSSSQTRTRHSQTLLHPHCLQHKAQWSQNKNTFLERKKFKTPDWCCCLPHTEVSYASAQTPTSMKNRAPAVHSCMSTMQNKARDTVTCKEILGQFLFFSFSWQFLLTVVAFPECQVRSQFCFLPINTTSSYHSSPMMLLKRIKTIFF